MHIVRACTDIPSYKKNIYVISYECVPTGVCVCVWLHEKYMYTVYEHVYT